MKIRNLAFCGVMASILTGWGALAADGDTVIASKAYVDAMDATKQDKNDRVTESWANSTADHDSTTKYPSMNTLDTAISGLNTSIGSGAWTANALDSTAQGNDSNGVANSSKLMKVQSLQSTTQRAQTLTSGQTIANVSQWDASTASDDTLPTTKAVAQQIGKASNTLNTAIATASSDITDQFEGSVTEGENGSMVVEDTGAAPDNVVVDADHPNLIPRNYNIQQGIAYLEGTGIENHNKSNQDGVGEGEIESTDSAWGTIIEAKAADDYVPTIAAVEKRVLSAASTATSNAVSHSTTSGDTALDLTSSTTKAPSVNMVKAMADTDEVASESGGTVTITAQTNTDDQHVPTSLTVKNDMDTLATAINKKLNANTAITAATSNSVVTYDTNGLVTGGVSLDETLRGVNAEAASSSLCSAANPCVLTYLGGTGANAKYRWTNMDTEGVSAASIN